MGAKGSGSSYLLLGLKIALAVAVLYIALVQYKNFKGRPFSIVELFDGKIFEVDDGCRKSVASEEIKRGERFKDEQYGFGDVCVDAQGELKESRTGKYIGSTMRETITLTEFSSHIDLLDGLDPVCGVHTTTFCSGDTDCAGVKSSNKGVYNELIRQFRLSKVNVFKALYDNTTPTDIPSKDNIKEMMSKTCGKELADRQYDALVSAA